MRLALYARAKSAGLTPVLCSRCQRCSNCDRESPATIAASYTSFDSDGSPFDQMSPDPSVCSSTGRVRSGVVASAAFKVSKKVAGGSGGNVPNSLSVFRTVLEKPACSKVPVAISPTEAA